MLNAVHLTWSREISDQCPICQGKTVLIVCPTGWSVDQEAAIEAVGRRAYEEQLSDGVEIHDEITGHYCPRCDVLTSLSLNTAAIVSA